MKNSFDGGVYEKLDYIKSLGCDGIWFSPLYPSPGVDCGYDISDYMGIAEEFGGMEAFKKVLDGAERGMKVIMDLVINHTSTEHEWFKKSRQCIEPYTDYYIWRPAKANGKLPNNWDSLFEGKAWQWDEVRQEYYMHLFAIEQADLNMDNPLVREEVKNILSFWLDLGVDGSRDSARTPVQWNDGENAGFTTGTPWFYINENYKDVNVANQKTDENSVLNFYRKVIKLRKELACVKDGRYTEYDKRSASLYTYSRENEKQKVLVVCSFSDKEEKMESTKRV